MSDPSVPQGKPPQNDPAHEPASKPPRRTDRTQSTKMLIWVAIGSAVLVALYFVASDQRAGQVKTISEFEKEVKDNKLGPGQIFELTLNPGYLRYQDQPSSKNRQPG